MGTVNRDELVEKMAMMLWRVTLQQRLRNHPSTTSDRWEECGESDKGEWREWASVAVRVAATPEVVANATLFAASWDMYRALQNLIESAEDGRPIPEWLQERLMEVNAALDKAEAAQR